MAWLKHMVTLAEDFGVSQSSEDHLYAAMDWLLERQDRVQKKLASRHLPAGGMVLYDLSSSYFEGSTCPLAKRGYNRDGKGGKARATDNAQALDEQLANEAAVVPPDNPLDDEASQDTLRQLLSWYYLEKERQALNRLEMAMNADFYDNLQWSPEDGQILKDRGQMPLVFNEVAPMVDWLIGTQRRTAVDWRVLPRSRSCFWNASALVVLSRHAIAWRDIFFVGQNFRPPVTTWQSDLSFLACKPGRTLYRWLHGVQKQQSPTLWAGLSA